VLGILPHGNIESSFALVPGYKRQCWRLAGLPKPLICPQPHLHAIDGLAPRRLGSGGGLFADGHAFLDPQPRIARVFDVPDGCSGGPPDLAVVVFRGCTQCRERCGICNPAQRQGNCPFDEMVLLSSQRLGESFGGRVVCDMSERVGGAGAHIVVDVGFHDSQEACDPGSRARMSQCPRRS